MSGFDTYGNESCLLKDPYDVGSANLNKSILERSFLIIQQDIKNNKNSVKDPAPFITHLGSSLSAQSLTM